MSFIKTNMLLEVNYESGEKIVYYTFKSTSHKANYFHVIEMKNYYLVGCYSGDVIRYYKDEKTVEYVNTVTNENTIKTDRTFKIYKDEN